MNSSTTGELRNPNSMRAKYALRIAIVLAVAFLGTLGLYLYMAQTIKAWQLYVLAAATDTAMLLNIVAMRYSLKKRVETAAYLMIASILILFPIATYVLSGVGLVLGIGGLIGIYMVATLTLLQPQLGRAITVGIALGVAMIVLDTFFSGERLEIRLLTIYIPVGVNFTFCHQISPSPRASDGRHSMWQKVKLTPTRFLL